MSRLLTKAHIREAQRENSGYCSHCEELTNCGVEPDARNIRCEQCRNSSVFGVEQALIEGLIRIAVLADGIHVNRSVYEFLTKSTDGADMLSPDEIIFEEKNSECVAMVIKYNGKLYTLSMDARYEASGGLCFSHPKYWTGTLANLGLNPDEINVGVKYLFSE